MRLCSKGGSGTGTRMGAGWATGGGAGARMTGAGGAGAGEAGGALGGLDGPVVHAASVSANNSAIAVWKVGRGAIWASLIGTG
ncbi:hypothetical protein FVQ98_15680 [Ottowia sp. GY511]|nr:hypothetical protein FVQ98_15680 [Ottowia sp. GY511]